MQGIVPVLVIIFGLPSNPNWSDQTGLNLSQYLHFLQFNKIQFYEKKSLILVKRSFPSHVAVFLYIKN